MDSATMILTVVSAVGGGTLLKVGEKIFGNNKVKELSDIIETMGKRIDKQDAKIIELETKVNESDDARVALSENLNRYKFAHTFLGLCQHKDECPIAMALTKKD